MSRHEGFGAPPCQAISFGTPALFLECGGTESVLGRAGCVSREEGQNRFADRILELLANEEARAELLQEQSAAVRELSSGKVSQRLYAILERVSTRWEYSGPHAGRERPVFR